MAELPYNQLTTRTGTKRGLIMIAADLHQCRVFLQKQGIPFDRERHIFISDPTRLWGMADMTILCVGEYWRSPIMQYPYIKHAQTLHNIRFVDSRGSEVRP